MASKQPGGAYTISVPLRRNVQRLQTGAMLVSLNCKCVFAYVLSELVCVCIWICLCSGWVVGWCVWWWCVCVFVCVCVCCHMSIVVPVAQEVSVVPVAMRQQSLIWGINPCWGFWAIFKAGERKEREGIFMSKKVTAP